MSFTIFFPSLLKKYRLVGVNAVAIALSSKLRWWRPVRDTGALAAIALHHKLNANPLRRWVEQAEVNERVLVPSSTSVVQSAEAPAFVPLPLETRNARPSEIRIDEPWLAVDPLDMRVGFDTALARVVKVFGAAHPHHA